MTWQFRNNCSLKKTIIERTSRKLHKLRSDQGLLVIYIDKSKDILVHLSLHIFTRGHMSLSNSSLVSLCLPILSYVYLCLPKFT